MLVSYQVNPLTDKDHEMNKIIERFALIAVGVAVAGCAVTLTAATTEESPTPTPTPIVVSTPTPTPIMEAVPAPVETEQPVQVPEPTPAPSSPVQAHTRPGDYDRATGPVSTYDEGTLFCGVGAGVAVDIDPYGNAWAYCEPALAQ